MNNNTKIYEIVNQQIIDQLEQGNIPWRMPWKTQFPQNYITKREYQSINFFLLGLIQMLKEYEYPYWMTFKQASEQGGRIKKGEAGAPIVFYKTLEFKTKDIDPKTGENIIKKIPLLRYYKVWNIAQIEGIEVKEEEKVFNGIKEAEEIIMNYKDKPEIRQGGDRAFWNVKEDYISIPKKTAFTSEEEYYSTLFHEFVHSTAHEKRLNREIANTGFHFGDENYSKEELVAELGNAYLCAKTGILQKTIKNSGAYINGWLKKLKEDKTILVSASAKAQKAVNYIGA